MSKIPIYFFPGMAASSLIFEQLKIDATLFKPVFLEWLPIDKKETLDDYVNRYLLLIHDPNPIVIGVSFGGIIAQELSKKIQVKKVIIISSVRSNKEYPTFFNLAKKTGIYRLLPTSVIPLSIKLFFWTIQRQSKNRKDLYDRYLSIRDPHYIKWCINAILNWNQSDNLSNVIQIHGTKDEVFPYQKIKHAIEIKDGTHAMILIKHKWFNQHLQTIILE